MTDPTLTPETTDRLMMITDGMVERGAKALWLYDVVDGDDDERDIDDGWWESADSPDGSDLVKGRYRRLARTVLEANLGWSIRKMRDVAHLPHPPAQQQIDQIGGDQ